jgi:hypothetical protein
MSCLLEPAGRLAHTDPAQHVRNEFPCQAACFRRALPRVVGLPYRSVLRSIRLPNRLRWAFPLPGLLHLPVGRSASTVWFQHRSVSGFPLVCPHSCIPSFNTFRAQERLGASQVLQRLSSCMPRPEDSGGPHPSFRPSCSPCLHGSAMDARLDTGGGLALTRQRLSPCKRRQAYLGAITPRLSRCRKRARSGRFRQSAPGPG